MFGREDYVEPVGFAREPRDERRRWLGRAFLFLLMLGLAWLLYNRVINPPADEPFQVRQSQLPAPV